MRQFFTASCSMLLLASLSACGGGASTESLGPETPQVAISISSNSATEEGDSGGVQVFRVSSSRVSASNIDVVFETEAGSAKSDEDFVATRTTATIAAGTTTAEIGIPILDDALDEPDETFTVRLVSTSSGTLGIANATGTIIDDDPEPILSVEDIVVAEGDTGQSDGEFSLALSAVSGFDVSVDYVTANGEAQSGSDYAAASGTLTIPAGSVVGTLSVPILGDIANEGNETFEVRLSNGAHVHIPDAVIVATIIDDDDPIIPADLSVSVADADSVSEASSSGLQFPVTLSEPVSTSTTVFFETLDQTAIGGSDYESAAGSVTIPAGSVVALISVNTTNDATYEVNESLGIRLTGVSAGSISNATATGTIIDDDTAPGLSIADASVAEGDAGQSTLSFTVSLDAVSGVDATVSFATADGTATSGSDYLAASGQLTIPAGQTEVPVDIAVLGDTVDEPDESFTVSLSDAANASILDASATGTITDDDTVPALSVSDASIVEGDSGSSDLTFTISLSAVSGNDVSVDYVSSDGSAVAGEDYVAVSGTATILAGTTEAVVTVTVSGDTLYEADESLELILSNPASASLATASATGTILDDDPLPVLSISDVSVLEGDAGQSTLTFVLTVDRASANDVSVSYASSDVTATEAEDYLSVSGVSTIAAGELVASILVPVVGDVIFENDESFVMTLTSPVNAILGTADAVGIITNDDSEPEISVADTSGPEGDTGQSNIGFVISLNVASGVDATVAYSTGDIDAVAALDYIDTSGSATIAAGDLQVTVEVPVIGDTLDEPIESLSLTLTDAGNASISDGAAIGTVIDDDPLPSLSISDTSIAEGDSGQVLLNFPVQISAVSGFDVSVDYTTVDDTAIAGEDYTASSGTVTVPAGSTTVNISILVSGDEDDEGDDSFFVSISGAVNATIDDASAVGTITNDDGAMLSGLDSRPSNLTCIAPARPTNNAAISTEIAFPNLPALTKPVALLRAPHDESTWYVVEQDGRILSFDDSSSVSATTIFLDIRSGELIDVESGTQEAGLFGIAFDPDYGNGNWNAYLSYTVSGTPLTSVIARLQSTDNGATLGPSTAEELIRVDQPYENHNGGHLIFGPDGYLYIHFGDGGAGNDPGDRAQDTSNLFGSLLRIDVNGGTPYAIPSDNPFAANSSLCDDGSAVAACPEIFAWGLRNAWRYSFDDATGQLWLADVGQSSWEEVNLIELGGNYGWRCREGSNDNITSGNCPPGLIDPIIEYSSQTVGDSITGGEVYRGAAIPELTGRYVFADYVRGKIFASVDNGDATYSYETLLDTSQFISSFAKEADGELLYLDYGTGNIRRIIQAGGSSVDTIPDQLSNTGCVSASNVAEPAEGLIPYDINVPFWSDGAVKDRYYAIPDGTSIDVADDGDWLFPIGTVLVKNFRLNGSLIETRLFMRHTDGEWGGYTYEWNNDETEATRLVGGKTKFIDGQDWIYPSGSECIQCHTATANYSLGLEHGQLNKNLTYPSTGITANQLTTADAVDLLTDPLPDDVDNLPRYPDPTNDAETLEDRARAYLHSNCSGCHRPFGPTPSDMDFRYSTPFSQTGTCNILPNSVSLGIQNARLIMPGDADGSLVVERAKRRDVHGMPPVGSTEIDANGVQLLTDWINSLSACP